MEVFSQAQREVSGRGGLNLYFQESFRSRQGIIDFVNRFFSMVMRGGESDFEMKYREGDHLQPQRRDWDGTPCIELMSGDDSGNADERRSVESAAIAAKIVRLVAGRDGTMVYDRVGTTGNQGTGDRREGTDTGKEDPANGSLYPVPCILSPAFTPRPPRFGDIAILFRRFSNLKVYEHELRRAGIPYYVVKGRGFYRCQEVLDILNFLSWLEYGGDLSALVGVLRSPLCGISDETLYLLSKVEGGIGNWEKLCHQAPVTSHQTPLFDRIDPADRERLASLATLVSRLRPLRDRLTLAELLEEILTGTDFASTLLTTFQGGQKVANLRKLIEISRSFADSERGTLRRFIKYLAELVEKEPTEAEALVSAEGEDVVRLMTIHQSKGLEFPVVFIPEMGMMHPPANSAVVCDEALGIGVRTALPGSQGRPTLAWREIGAQRRRKEGSEIKRLLYVAMTRARDYLVLSGEGRGEWRSWLSDFLAGDDATLVKCVDASGLLDESPVLPSAGESTTAVEPEWGADVIAAALKRTINYTPPPPSEMIFSPTALEDYRNCPRKYFYKAVLGLDEGLFAELLGKKHSAGKSKNGLSAIDKGNLAHLLLERLDFTASAELQRAACDRLAPILSASPFDGSATGVIDDIMAFAVSPLAGELAGSRLYREHPFILKLKGNADYFVRGAMDLVAVTERRAVVYDYKYLRMEDADQDGYRFQIRTYMLVLARAFPGKEISGALLFLRGGSVEQVTCDFPMFEKELLEIMEGVRLRSCETEFDLREGCDGSHCPFRRRCLAQD